MVLTEAEKNERPFSVDEAAEFLGLHHKTVVRWINEGKIKAVKLGREWRIKRSEIDRLLEGE